MAERCSLDVGTKQTLCDRRPGLTAASLCAFIVKPCSYLGLQSLHYPQTGLQTGERSATLRTGESKLSYARYGFLRSGCSGLYLLPSLHVSCMSLALHYASMCQRSTPLDGRAVHKPIHIVAFSCALGASSAAHFAAAPGPPGHGQPGWCAWLSLLRAQGRGSCKATLGGFAACITSGACRSSVQIYSAWQTVASGWHCTTLRANRQCTAALTNTPIWCFLANNKPCAKISISP